MVCAAGSMPGDLHKLWRTRDRKGYHVEYGFSCMGYEIAGGLGVKMAVLDAGEDRDVVVMVGDGSYLMMAQEIVTAVQEGVKLIVVLVQNHGFASIGALSESLGSQRFGTRYRYRTADRPRRRRAPGRPGRQRRQPRGAACLRAAAIAELEKAFAEAQAADVTTVIHVETDPLVPAPDSPAWWDVPVAEVASLGVDAGRSGRRTRTRSRGSAATCAPPTNERDDTMRTIDHWVGGKTDERGRRPAAAASGTRRRASSRPRSRWPARDDVDAAVRGGERGVRRAGRRRR